jgi:hypothetical protein
MDDTGCEEHVGALADRLNGAPTEAPLAGLVIAIGFSGVCVGAGAGLGDEGGDGGGEDGGEDGEVVVEPGADFGPPPQPVPWSTTVAANKERTKE